MRAVVVLALAACAPPASVLHGEHAGVSLADLAPVWRVDEKIEAVVADGGWLAVVVNGGGGARSFQLIDQRDGYTTPRLASDDLTWAHDTVIDGTRIATYSLHSKKIVLADRPHEHDERVVPRWSTPVGADPLVGKIAIDRERVYAALMPSYTTRKVELRALRAGDGELAWTQPLPDGASLKYLDGGPRAVAAGSISHPRQPGEAYAFGFDPATGDTRWTYRAPAALATIADDGHVVFARAAVLTVLDRTSGRERDIRVPELSDSTVPDLVIRDGIAYAASWLPGASGATAFAIGLDDGRMRWQRRVPTSHSVLATAHAVYVLTTGGVLHALDRESGAPLWEWGIGIPKVQLVAGTLGDERVFVIRNDAVIAFAPHGPLPPVEDAVIRTKITPMCADASPTVVVGDTEVKPRKSGEVEAHVRTRGTVYVQAPDMEDHEVELTGHREYRLSPMSSLCNVP